MSQPAPRDVRFYGGKPLKVLGIHAMAGSIIASGSMAA
jgi:hypothetical protein